MRRKMKIEGVGRSGGVHFSPRFPICALEVGLNGIDSWHFVFDSIRHI